MTLREVVGALRKHYGSPVPPPTNDPFELILWETVVYLAPVARRREAFDDLRRTIGTNPRAILAARRKALEQVTARGILKRTSADKMQEAARIALERFDGNLSSVIDRPVAEATRALRLFPGIGEPARRRSCSSADGLHSSRQTRTDCAFSCVSDCCARSRCTRRPTPPAAISPPTFRVMLLPSRRRTFSCSCTARRSASARRRAVSSVLGEGLRVRAVGSSGVSPCTSTIHRAKDSCNARFGTLDSTLVCEFLRVGLRDSVRVTPNAQDRIRWSDGAADANPDSGIVSAAARRAYRPSATAWP